MAKRTIRPLTRQNLGFLLAKASQRWNELIHARFKAAGFGHVRPAYGALLVPLFEEDGLTLGELGRRALLSKQTMTTMVRQLEAARLVRRAADPKDARAQRVHLTAEARRFRPIAEAVVAALEAEMLALGKGAPAARLAWLSEITRFRR
jgi:DNA-binding MarR family transcriptional regulator